MTERYIVAEVSRSWHVGKGWRDGTLILQDFERVLNENAKRGYRLLDWRLDRTWADGCLNETIVAVFESDEAVRVAAKNRQIRDCAHSWYSDDGVDYCSKCGIARCAAGDFGHV